MDTNSSELIKQLKPVTVDEDGLLGIQASLRRLLPDGVIHFSVNNNNRQEANNIMDVIKVLRKSGKDTPDYLEFDFQPYNVRFFKNKTIVDFKVMDEKSKATFFNITDYLEENQNRNIFAKQYLNLLNKPKKKDFFEMDVNTLKGALIVVVSVAILDLLIRLGFKIFGGE